METNSNTKSSSVNATSPTSKKPALEPTRLQHKISKRQANKYADRTPKELISSLKNEDTESYLDSFPAGYRFCPLDGELVVYYLKKKILNEPLPPNRINEISIYQYNPYELAEMYKGYGYKEIYFFTPRERKYRHGSRPNRAAGDGYWKATGADKSVKFNGEVVGYKKALVFYQGKPPRGDKTNWIMHEYRVISSAPSNRGENDMRLDDCVLCRIYKKVIRNLKSRHKKEDEHSMAIEDADEHMSFDGGNGCTSIVTGYDNTANTYKGYMHHLFQLNPVPQMPTLLDIPLDNMYDQYQLDADMFFGHNYSDQFGNPYPKNFSFEPLDLMNRLEDSMSIKNPNDLSPKKQNNPNDKLPN